jgi:DTW domain-containing protein YfiP
MPRRTRQRRCTGCGLIPERCLCERLPRIRLPWPIVVLQHRKERHKPTNTARLLPRVIEGCVLLTIALPDRPWSAAQLGSTPERFVVVFPSADAERLDAARLDALAESKCGLLLLDGSWRQAGRMVRRADGVAQLPRVALPPGGPSRWPARRAPRPDQLCTFETVVRIVALASSRYGVEAAELERSYQWLLAAQSGRDP